MQIYLIRHTTPEVERGICYGQTDLQLAASYPDELERLRNTLPRFNRIYTSPLYRCHTLAKALAGDDLIIDDRLKELNFGDWEMQAWNEIDRAPLEYWMEDFVNRRCPNGESFKDLENRVLAFWEEVIDTESSESIALVTHGGIIRALVFYFLEGSLKNAFNLHLDYGRTSMLEKIKDRVRVMWVNG